MMYFGTDGIRGISNREITPQLAHAVGNALTQCIERCRVVVGRDTRRSGSMLAHALAAGVMQGGGEVLDVDILPTPGIAYLSKLYQADFGIVISASHNPPEYNGIKVFDARGYKLDEAHEARIEAAMANIHSVSADGVGTYEFVHNAADSYIAHLVGCGVSLKGKRILLDCANGAAWDAAPRAFRLLGAQVDALHVGHGGADINDRCGALWAQLLSERMRAGEYDMGFAFDGDSDRLIALDEKGNVVDGDQILYILSMFAKSQGKAPDTVVGTFHTNMGIERALADAGIRLLRADIGDKYVLQSMLRCGAKLGAEQSGHIILSDYATTGDGILSAIVLSAVVSRAERPLSQCNDVELYPQCNRSIPVGDKLRIINNSDLAEQVERVRRQLGDRGRVLLRASGTEPKVRVTVECDDRDIAEKLTHEIVDFILKLNFQA